MVCISDLPFEILLKGGTPAQCEALIRENSDEVYHVPGGYTIRGVLLSGDSIPIGVKGDEIFFQYIKPCFGLFVLKLPDASDEIERLHSQFKK
ncbi:DUF1894 domain-containing protein [Methanolobus sp. ZRKC2]|uniref:DUF1894 domain-containing protein n=1 Tax=Methanolobus sp. ZRKC2 TaxID=3125783 RepID=UPI003255316F